jgi:hypothetical protein
MDRSHGTLGSCARYGGGVMTDRIGKEPRSDFQQMLLLRQLLGSVLRRTRLRQGRTLREVSADARVSLGYLSEVERGQKEASSELLVAICAALEVPQSEVLRSVSEDLAAAEGLRRIVVSSSQAHRDVVAAA